ncbi:MAG: carboxy terminal-processing peptidase [Gammaproteobacteria bacterium]
MAASLVENTAAALAAKVRPVSPEREQVRAAVNVVRQLQQSHYRQQPVNGALASRLFDNYLKSLDEQRIYFLASDIAELERLRPRFEPALKSGDLEPAFAVYNRHLQRLVERLQYLISENDKGIARFDFGKDEYIELDRKDARWPATRAEMNDIWRRRLKAAMLDLRLSGKEDAEIQTLLEKRYRNQLNRALQIRSEDAFSAYMNALGGLYDPHTEYLSPQTSENFAINMSLELQGIGAVLQTEDEYTKIVKLVPGSPAERSQQLKPADRIVSVAQGNAELVDVVGWRLDEVVELIRGPKGTQVRLEIIPASAADNSSTRVVSLVRDAVKLEEQAARKQVLETTVNGQKLRIGVIQLPTFYIDFDGRSRGDPDYRSTTRDVANLITELRKERIDGLVLDLRDNGGGSLDEAQSLVGLFIRTGPVVQVRWANNRTEVNGDYDPAVHYDGPLAVMTNRLSASASEIFAGAIQDYGRGLVIGEQTFGKGTVQTVRPLNHGQIKVTQAKFYRISGDSTQLQGVVPDIVFPGLVDKTQVGESALDDAMPWDTIRPARFQRSVEGRHIAELLPELRRRSEQRAAGNPDFQYLREQLVLVNESRAEKRLSLNETVRRKERDQMRQRSLDIENKRRKAKGEPPLKTYEELEKINEELASSIDENVKNPVDQALLLEGSTILADKVVQMRQRAATAANGSSARREAVAR